MGYNLINETRKEYIKMKIKNGFLLRQSGDKYEIIKEVSGEAVMSELSETEVFLWEKVSDEFTENTLVSAILMNFDVDGATAELEAYDFLSALREAGIL